MAGPKGSKYPSTRYLPKTRITILLGGRGCMAGPKGSKYPNRRYLPKTRITIHKQINPICLVLGHLEPLGGVVCCSRSTAPWSKFGGSLERCSRRDFGTFA